MKKTIALAITSLFAASSMFAADATPTDQVKAGIAKDKAAANYSWTTTLTIADMQFTPGPVKGKAEKDGFAMVSQEMNDNKLEAVMKGDKVALKNESQWQLIDEADGFVAMMGGFLTANGTALDEAEKLLKYVKELKAGEAGLISGDLTTEGAGTMMAFRPRGANAGAPPAAPKNAKGSVKFWIKDGALVKIESHISGATAFGPDQEERQMDTTRTIEISDLGTTKLEVPADAKKKFETK